MPVLFAYLTTQLRSRWQRVRGTRDGGYSTETVLVTALLVALAILAIGYIATTVADKAQNLDLG